MDIETFRTYCLKKPGVTESLPFDENTLVFKVGGKMFALTDLEDPFAITLKATPEDAVRQRESYPGTVTPGYHMHKKHWNTTSLYSSPVPGDAELYRWIDESYQLVYNKLTQKIRKQIEEEPHPN
ncbi:MAG: MmcQ/YjbR family DNA-binding protein [Bacteroidales bacterium]|jgi:predicted DNA-binding protein (MmcQ/YjbR family)